MKYDDASWHYGGDFPGTSPNEYAGVHIGLFIKWCYIKGFAPTDTDVQKDVDDVVNGVISGTEYLFRNCDGKFTNEDLNSKGNSFAEYYYENSGSYFEDYANFFGDHMYVDAEEKIDFTKYSQMVERRYKKWIKRNAIGSSKQKSLWKFW